MTKCSFREEIIKANIKKIIKAILPIKTSKKIIKTLKIKITKNSIIKTATVWLILR